MGWSDKTCAMNPQVYIPTEDGWRWSDEGSVIIHKFTYFLETDNENGIIRQDVWAWFIPTEDRQKRWNGMIKREACNQSRSSHTFWTDKEDRTEQSDKRSAINSQVHILPRDRQRGWDDQTRGLWLVHKFTYFLKTDKEDGMISWEVCD